MKKISFLIISLFVMLTVSGCGNTKVLTCISEEKGNNMNGVATVKYTFKNDKMTKAKIEATFKDIQMDDLATNWDTYKAQLTEQNKPIKEKGFKRTVKSNDKKYTFTVNIDIDFTKVSKDTMDKYGILDYSSRSYDEVKEEMNASGSMTCK